MSRRAAPPTAPPPLSAMGARKDKLESERAELFKQWKAALEATDGNITQAAVAAFGHRYVSPERLKSYGMYLTKTFELRDYATALRVKAGQGKQGRPKGKK